MVSVAQWIARRTSNPKVVGSNPTRDDVFLSKEFELLSDIMYQISLLFQQYSLAQQYNEIGIQ